MNYLLFDNPRQEYSFIAKLWGNKDLREVSSPYNRRKIIGWLQGVLTVLKHSHKDDTIICWFDFQAVLAYWLGLFTFHRRRIVCINLMLKDKDTLRNKLVGWLYKGALSSNKFKASVTSVEYGEWLNRRFSASFHFYLIRDVFHEEYTLSETVKKQPDTVFCGGNNGRDWLFMLKVAQRLPDVKFRFVMPANLYESLKTEIPQNVAVHCNMPYTEFMREMCAATIVALPLDTIAPAGLIVLFQAAANNKPIIMTDTVTTRGYITSDRGVLLPNEERKWADCIQYQLAHPEICSAKAENLRMFLSKSCNEQTFVNGIKQLISSY